ncbi:chorismate synthase [Candidatus Peregrinibacteria bacterium CG_4_9_14_0_2_um_filter_53_11]|nr:MAG: chorismate synthase [Candidatus Peregrinibacteria bacterium CG_4_9_14_0_2_um_filter_53_11]
MGNTFGLFFRVTTFGESHGAGLGCVIDGCPPNLPIDLELLQHEMDRRRPGQSDITTPRNEGDKVKVLSGIFEGVTLGTPIALMIENTNQQSKDYSKLKDVFRPGHADYTWQMKYGIRDYRGGGRSSGRETSARVMAGAIAKQILGQLGISVIAFSRQIGEIRAEKIDLSTIEKNLVRTADPDKAPLMEELVLKAKEEGDSVGGIVELLIQNAPVGLGEPVFDKINADLAKAIVSIPTVKGIEFGAGFDVATKKGSENNDTFVADKESEAGIGLAKNDAGGIAGGITTGQDIVMRIAVKPPSSINKEQKTVDAHGNPITLEVGGRHDPCIIPRFIPVAESMAAIVILDHLLRYRALCPDKVPFPAVSATSPKAARSSRA